MKQGLAAFKTDQSLETEGIVLQYPDFWVRIARAGGGNRRFARAQERLMRPYRRAIATGTMDDRVAERVLAEIFAEGVVLEWGTEPGVVGPIPGVDGEPLDFSRENVVKALTDAPDFFADVREQANKVALFVQGDDEADRGN